MIVVLQQIHIDFQPGKDGEVDEADTLGIPIFITESITDWVVVIAKLKCAVVGPCCGRDIDQASLAENRGLCIAKRTDKNKKWRKNGSFQQLSPMKFS